MAQPVLGRDGNYYDGETGQQVYNIGGKWMTGPQAAEYTQAPIVRGFTQFFEPQGVGGKIGEAYMSLLGRPFASMFKSGQTKESEAAAARAARMVNIPGPASQQSAAPAARQSQPSVPYADLMEKATNAGREYADQQKQFGLFGNLVNNMFDSPIAAQITDRLMQVFARPEFTQTGFGVTPVTAFARANYALQQSEAEAAQKAAELDAQVKVAQAKAGVKKPLTESSINLVRSAQSQKGALDLLENSLKLIAGNQLSSVGPQAIELASNIGAFFGIDTGPTALRKYQQNVAGLKQKLAESRSFGRELNKQELDIVAKLITEPGLFTKDSELHNQLKSLFKKAQQGYVVTTRLMEQSGLNPQSLLGMPEAKNQYPAVIKSRQ